MSSETRSNQPRYWCHICSTEVPVYMAPDPTCQRCNEQFIEEVQADDDPREFLNGTDNTNGETPGFQLPNIPNVASTHIFTFSPTTGRFARMNGEESEMSDDIFRFLSPLRAGNSAGHGNRETQNSDNPSATSTDNADSNEDNAENTNVNPLGNLVQNIISSVLEQTVDINTTGQPTGENGQPRSPMVFVSNLGDAQVRFESVPTNATAGGGANSNEGEGNTNSTTENNNTTNNQTPRGNNLANILQFLSTITGSPLDGGIVGNPNDYVFSQTALDNIITQLMEQNGGGAAPPPAPENVIESLQHRDLTEEEKSQETDCAVCKDQFGPTERVLELPCNHIFHDECIKPWLKLNSTCPVCRHSVLSDAQANENNNSNNNNNNNNGSNDSNGNNDNNDSTDSNNTQNTEQNSNNGNSNNQEESNRSTNTNNNENSNTNNSARNNTFTSATFTWIGGSENDSQTGRGQRIPGQIPINMSWLNDIARQSGGQTRGQPFANFFTASHQQQNSSTNSANNENSDSHMDEDLDLD